VCDNREPDKHNSKGLTINLSQEKSLNQQITIFQPQFTADKKYSTFCASPKIDATLEKMSMP
jgi:hypothetical protein